MKNLIYLTILALMFIACGEKDLRSDLDVRYKEVYKYVSSGNEGNLRPYLGFTGIAGTWGTKFDFYCDPTENPTTLYRENQGSYTNLSEKDMFKPNTKYYWWCKGKNDSPKVKGETQSEIYSFTTIDTARIYNQVWASSYIINIDDYFNYHPIKHQSYKKEFNNNELFGEVYSFRGSRDSINGISYFDLHYEDEAYPSKGVFSFSLDTVHIINKKYGFINLGKHHEDKLMLALRVYETDLVIVYEAYK